jgi:hypothetical protein
MSKSLNKAGHNRLARVREFLVAGNQNEGQDKFGSYSQWAASSRREVGQGRRDPR